MHREVFAGRPGPLLTVGEMPGVTVEEARLFTDPARARGRHGVPVRARRARPRRRQVGRPARCDLRDLKASLGRWQAGLADVGWNSLYWNNHDQPRAVSRFGDDGELPGAVGQAARHRAAPAPRARRTSTRARSSGMTNAPLRRRSTTSATSSRSTTTPRRSAAGRRPAAGARRAAADEPRQRPHADAVGRVAPTPASPPATPWIAVNPNYSQINAAAQRRRPELGLPPLPPADRAAARRARRRARRLHDAAPRRRAGLRLHALLRRRRAARRGELLRQRRSTSRRSSSPPGRIRHSSWATTPTVGPRAGSGHGRPGSTVASGSTARRRNGARGPSALGSARRR